MVGQANDLTPDERAKYETQGYVGPFTAFDPVEMERVRRIICDTVLRTPTPYAPVHPNKVRHLDSRTVFDVCQAPPIVDRVASVYGPDLLLWASTVFDKPPARDGALESYPWHKESYYWDLDPMQGVSAWLALTEATQDNGCMELIPGSHRCDIPWIQEDDPRNSLWFSGRAADPARFSDKDRVQMILEPGQFFLFSESLLHRSNPNDSQTRRCGLSMRYTQPSVRIRGAPPSILVRGRDGFGHNPCVSPPAGDPSRGAPVVEAQLALLVEQRDQLVAKEMVIRQLQRALKKLEGVGAGSGAGAIESLNQQLEAKEAVIQELAAVCRQRDEELLAKEAVIGQLAARIGQLGSSSA